MIEQLAHTMALAAPCCVECGDHQHVIETGSQFVKISITYCGM